MIDFLILIALYFILLIILGIIAYNKTSKTPEDYFLANRTFGPVILLFTLAATNFSSFTFLGFAGNSYKVGLGQYGIMGFGTAIMAITFYVIGRKVWILGKKNKYITPAELIGDRFNSNSLRILFMFIMIIFTIPYLAVQAIGAGFIIQYLTESITWEVGAIVTMFVIMFYVLLGGMRGSGWTDVIQGVIMITAMTIAFIFITINLGGFETANIQSFNANPQLFTRPGVDDFFLPGIWFSFMMLWILADPMFPQIFQRFYTAKNQKSLKITMILYPIVVSFLFLFPVLIGVWAHGAGLNISPGSEDMVLPMMVAKYTPSFVFSFVMIGALAALMSTADSQLLTLSNMLSRDLPFKKFIKNEILIGKILIFVLAISAIIYVLNEYDPNEGIMGTLVKTTFSGLAVLFPTTIAALYWRKATKYGCILSIIFGEIYILLSHYGFFPSFGFLPAIPAVFISAITLIIIGVLSSIIKKKN